MCFIYSRLSTLTLTTVSLVRHMMCYHFQRLPFSYHMRIISVL